MVKYCSTQKVPHDMDNVLYKIQVWNVLEDRFTIITYP